MRDNKRIWNETHLGLRSDKQRLRAGGLVFDTGSRRRRDNAFGHCRFQTIKKKNVIFDSGYVIL